MVLLSKKIVIGELFEV